MRSLVIISRSLYIKEAGRTRKDQANWTDSFNSMPLQLTSQNTWIAVKKVAKSYNVQALNTVGKKTSYQLNVCRIQLYFSLHDARWCSLLLVEAIFHLVCTVGKIYTPIFPFFQKKSRQYFVFRAKTTLK